jgi:uncharacterized protein (TIGR03086 family)
MTHGGAADSLAGEPRMLEQAIDYALGTVQVVTPELLSRPTPCSCWDLRMLLRHASESLAALREGIDAGRVSLCPSADDPTANPVRTFRESADLLLCAWARASRPRDVIAIADRCMPADIMAAAGALEIAVHGWDVSRACGYRRPIPRPLAADLLALAPLLVPAAGRHPLFAGPVPVPARAIPSDRLAAFLGRAPWPSP